MRNRITRRTFIAGASDAALEALGADAASKSAERAGSNEAEEVSQ